MIPENKKTYIGQTAILTSPDEDFVALIKNSLEEMGFAVITGLSHKEGEKLVYETKYDLAIFSIIMDKKADSGFVLSYLSKKSNQEVPVMIMADPAESVGFNFINFNKQKCYWIKADEVVETKIRKEQLRRVVDKLFAVVTK